MRVNSTRGGLPLRLVVLTTAVLLTTAASAQGKVALIAEKLQYPPTAGQPDDFRVRTSAALALGASADEAAVGPLCRGLQDPNETVRVAAGAALKKLAMASAVGCVRARLGGETSASAKAQLQETLQALGGGGGDFSPRNVPNAKFYVSIKVENKTSRSQDEIERLVLKAMRQKLDALDIQLAPNQETIVQATQVIKDRKLKGYYLSVTVDPFSYTGSGLNAKVRAAVLTYPGKDLKGEVPSNATMPGVSAQNKSSENALLEALASNVAQRFADNFR